jgi:antagonist of KipI
MSIRIIKKGTFDTLQDLGRFGYQHLGIPPGGAMDCLALQLANFLVGNGAQEACLEMFYPAPIIRFEADALIALCGAQWEPRLQGLAAENNRAIWVKRGVELRFHRPKTGRVAYLAVRGGFAGDLWLGSYSTQMGVKRSGWKGRALHRNDRLPFRGGNEIVLETEKDWLRFPWTPAPHTTNPLAPIRVIADQHFNLLHSDAQTLFLRSSFTIMPESSRKGLLLKGATLEGNHRELISTAMQSGTIQWLPDGQLIVLLADRPTTGGYPRIAKVVQADLHRLAQWPLETPISFAMMSREQAAKLFQKQRLWLTQMQRATAFRLASYLEQQQRAASSGAMASSPG